VLRASSIFENCQKLTVSNAYELCSKRSHSLSHHSPGRAVARLFLKIDKKPLMRCEITL